jgi:hypothetical protein
MPRQAGRESNATPASRTERKYAHIHKGKGSDETEVGALVVESFELEEEASRIQRGEQVGLSSADIKGIVRRYDDWYARCLSVLPDASRGRFEAEYEGKWHAPGIKKFLEEPTLPSPLHTEESKSVFPYESAFRTRIRAQRQILREVEERQAAAVARQAAMAERFQHEIVEGTVFIAMPMSPDDPMLDDVHDAIKQVATEIGMIAERVDEPHTTARITDRILEQLAKAEYVVADLTHNKPNVYYEAGYAHALGKTPIYIARESTHIEFDLKDYPILFFNNVRQLRNQLSALLQGLEKTKLTK